MSPDTITVGAAPQIVQPVQQGVTAFCEAVVENAALATLLVIIGGGVIVVAIGVLLANKLFPQSRIGQAVDARGVAGCVFALLLGLCLIAPVQVVPFLAAFLATVVQWILDIVSLPFGI